MMPLEPARFSTTIGWPSASLSFSPSTRPAMSGAPPGGIGISSLIGRVGYCWATARSPAATRHAATRAAAATNLFIVSSSSVRPRLAALCRPVCSDLEALLHFGREELFDRHFTMADTLL